LSFLTEINLSSDHLTFLLFHVTFAAAVDMDLQLTSKKLSVSRILSLLNLIQLPQMPTEMPQCPFFEGGGPGGTALTQCPCVCRFVEISSQKASFNLGISLKSDLKENFGRKLEFS